MKFVEERLRKQANGLAKEELAEEMAFISRSNFLRTSFDKRSRIFSNDENDNYTMGNAFFYNGGSESAITHFKSLIDKRTEEIYQDLADELLKKIGGLDFLFKECE